MAKRAILHNPTRIYIGQTVDPNYAVHANIILQAVADDFDPSPIPPYKVLEVGGAVRLASQAEIDDAGVDEVRNRVLHEARRDVLKQRLDALAGDAQVPARIRTTFAALRAFMRL